MDMLYHYCFTNGSDDQDDTTRKNLQALIVSMAALESEMSAFNVYVVTQHMHDKPLNMWPKYEQYCGLGTASKELEDTVKGIKTLVQSGSFSNMYCIDMYTFQAREISIKVSNTIATVMKTMSDKTIDIETEARTDAHESTEQDTAIVAIMFELAEVIKHLTTAAESTWAALNLLETIAAKSSLQQANKFAKMQSYLPWACCAFTAILALSTFFNGLHNASQPPDLNDMRSSIAEMQSVCGLVNKNLDIAAYVRNDTLAEIDQRLLAIEHAWQDNNERIDNVWEALGPPNAEGTYFIQEMGAPDERPIDSRVLKARMDKLEADALEFKRQVQRAEVRTASRLNKLDRKRGGSGETEVE
ncbi:hypothetical protein DPSP01_001443 [Paraphaeosphaeria sporulosa]|uniref:Uncharacterized protein n=1 Tax=Paraphaeosphaeria sporulosa TaxID=1460663 RepID=A0A177CHY5_9PLEO|nr:uncharacterized protein CC84DRAFT_622826 [Paraphaeosphaeria sporulosa]OAG06851.1 hypothetical protein CC84DRAFT_622826 [Paraphaeosphaeria sporulosa]